MGATATALTPQDNRELLGAIAAAVSASREENERRLFDAKREVVLGLGLHPVLIAVRDGMPLSEPGPSGRVMLAFTDDEAAAAWARGRHAAASAAEVVSSAELAQGEPSRRRWMQWLTQRGARSIALNTAGPLGSIVHADELRTMRPRLLRRGATIEADHPWLDLPARETERARAGQLLEALTEAIANGDESAFERLRPQLPTVNEIGSLLWAAQLQFLSGRHQLARGNAKDGLYQMIYGSFAWGRFGDVHRCIDGVLDAGGLLLEHRGPEHDWRASYLSELRGVLEVIDTRYRGRDAARMLAAARERP